MNFSVRKSIYIEAVAEEFELSAFGCEGRNSLFRVTLIEELIEARQKKGIGQKKLEELSGVKQPVIARMEKGLASPQLDTIIKVLAPLGKTLAIVPLETK